MITIGLTGGIGSGKSTVGAMLAARGAVVVDSDLLAREAVEPGTSGYRQVVEHFGPDVVGEGGYLDRARLAAVVFADSDALADLNAIVHPEVGRLMLERVAERSATDDVVVLDVPLLIEAGGRERFGVAGVLVVDAPVELAVERLVRDRGMSREDAERRIAAQVGRGARLAAADFVIVNTGTLEELEEMVSRAWEWMKALRAALP